MPNTNFQTVHQFGAGISQVVRQATGRDPVHNINMEHVTVAQNKRGYPVQSYTGNPLTFTGEQPGYLGSVLLEMFVRQNLNGQQYPWPGGYEINKLPPPVAGSWTKDGITITAGDDGIIHVEGTCEAASYFVIRLTDSYTVPLSMTQGGDGCIYFNNSYANSGITFTFENDSGFTDNWGLIAVNRISDFYSALGEKTITKYELGFSSSMIGISVDFTLSPMVSDNSRNDNPYSPYSNICPITSRNDVAVLIDRNGEREVYNSDFPAPGVYAGTFNMATGELNSTWAALPVSVLEWQRTTGSDTPRMYAAVPNMLNDVSHRFQIYTTHFRTITDTSVAVPDLPMYSIYAAGGGSENVYVRVPDDMTVEQFEQEFADAMIVYPVNVPDISQLPKHVIPTAIGTNTVITDADLLEVTLYYLGDI